jgi:hypothetical protein
MPSLMRGPSGAAASGPWHRLVACAPIVWLHAHPSFDCICTHRCRICTSEETENAPVLDGVDALRSSCMHLFEVRDDERSLVVVFD